MLIYCKEEDMKHGGRLKPITGHIVLEVESGRCFKMSQFESSACFINENIVEPKFMTMTPYDLFFLAVQKVWPAKIGCTSSLDGLLEEKDMHLFSILEEHLKRVCNCIEAKGSQWYTPSEDKIIDELVKKYNRLMKVCQEKNISLKKPGLQQVNDGKTMNPVVIGIFHHDIDKYFINKMAEKLEMKLPTLQPTQTHILQRHFQEEMAHETKKPNNMRKSGKGPSKSQQNKQKQIRFAQATHHSLLNFIKKTPSKQEPKNQPTQP